MPYHWVSLKMRTMLKISCFVLTTLLLLSACGGGDNQDLYQGASKQAAVETPQEARVFADEFFLVFAMLRDGKFSPAISSDTGDVINWPALVHGETDAAAGEYVLPCDEGQVVVTVSVSDAPAAQRFQSNFTSCLIDGTRLSGTSRVIRYAPAPDTTHSRVVVDYHLGAVGQGFDRYFEGQIEWQSGDDGSRSAYLSGDVHDRVAQTYRRYQHLQLARDASGEQLIQGRIYDSVAGYVDIETITGLRLPTSNTTEAMNAMAGLVTLKGVHPGRITFAPERAHPAAVASIGRTATDDEGPGWVWSMSAHTDAIHEYHQWRAPLNASQSAPTLYPLQAVAPVIHASGPDVNSTLGWAAVDASASVDGNGDFISFNWELLSGPVGSSAMLMAPLRDSISVTLQRADIPGTYLIGLTVNDGAHSVQQTFEVEIADHLE